MVHDLWFDFWIECDPGKASLMMISPMAVLCTTWCWSIPILQAINSPYGAEAGIPSAGFWLESDQNWPGGTNTYNDFQGRNTKTMCQQHFVFMLIIREEWLRQLQSRVYSLRTNSAWMLSSTNCSANLHLLWYTSVFVKPISAKNISPVIYQPGFNFCFKSY